jgi:CxxC motif-containing protein (DUF1111 family)
MNKYIIAGLTVLSLLFFSCGKTMPKPSEEDALLDGPMEGLNSAEKIQFLRGDEAFAEVFTSATGLGPIFVANQCSSCHAGDGKGHPFVTFTRFGQGDTLGNTFLNQGGPQLQHKALPGFSPEILPNGAPSTNLIAPAVSGLGFLDAVSDADLIALSDPNDGDGISGIPHWNNIPEFVTLRPNTVSKNGKYITRFGKKGGAYNLLHQTVGAYNQDMGITSDFMPIDPYSGIESDPEVSTNTVKDIVAYLKTLKAPIQRDPDNADVNAGNTLFTQIDCGKCHSQTLQTGESPIDALSNKTFHPYTDLLLHDMGADLDDGYTEGFAQTYEWKTPPLWGLGLSKDSQGGTFFLLHDGRAMSIEEAILFHGGEAQQAKNKYNALSQSEKKQLIKFLESL